MTFLGEFNEIGNAWVEVIKYITSKGREVILNEECYREVKGISLNVTVTNEYDWILKKYADETNIAWMNENFKAIKPIKELKYANSYASRLFNYAGKKNQMDWIIKKLNKSKISRSATITMFEPLTDEEYIPCICLLDFDVYDNELDVYVYARSLDFGKKAYANLICIHDLLKQIADNTKLLPGTIHLVCKSAHVYKDDYNLMEKLCKDFK